jgi:predicted aspartyl protease
MIDAVIVGFTSFLTLSFSVLAALNLRAYRREEGIPGDGSTCIFEVYHCFASNHGVLGLWQL